MFSGGHLYYNNNVIKIRYDLLDQEKNLRDFDEMEIFDYYKDIIQLEPNEQVQMGTPIPEHKSKRLIYQMKNKIDISSKRILILPFLQMRQVFLMQQ